MLNHFEFRSPVPVPLPAPGSGPLPRGTSAVERYLASLGPAYAPKTRRCLASDWVCFARWCAENARKPFPAAPATVIAYLKAQPPPPPTDGAARQVYFAGSLR